MWRSRNVCMTNMGNRKTCSITEDDFIEATIVRWRIQVGVIWYDVIGGSTIKEPRGLNRGSSSCCGVNNRYSRKCDIVLRKKSWEFTTIFYIMSIDWIELAEGVEAIGARTVGEGRLFRPLRSLCLRCTTVLWPLIGGGRSGARCLNVYVVSHEGNGWCWFTVF